MLQDKKKYLDVYFFFAKEFCKTKPIKLFIRVLVLPPGTGRSTSDKNHVLVSLETFGNLGNFRQTLWLIREKE